MESHPACPPNVESQPASFPQCGAAFALWRALNTRCAIHFGKIYCPPNFRCIQNSETMIEWEANRRRNKIPNAHNTCDGMGGSRGAFDHKCAIVVNHLRTSHIAGEWLCIFGLLLNLIFWRVLPELPNSSAQLDYHVNSLDHTPLITNLIRYIQSAFGQCV